MKEKNSLNIPLTPYKSLKYAKGKKFVALGYYVTKYRKKEYQISLFFTTTDKCVFVDILDITDTGIYDIEMGKIKDYEADITDTEEIDMEYIKSDDFIDDLSKEVDINEFKHISPKLSLELDKMVCSFILRFIEIDKLDKATQDFVLWNIKNGYA